MSYQLVSQSNNRSQFIDMADADNALTVTAERIYRRVSGFKVPHVRMNLLSTLPLSFMPAGCVDSCAAPAELQRTVRTIVNGPVISKAELIVALEWQILTLKSADFNQVWEGFQPPPGLVITSPILGA